MSTHKKVPLVFNPDSRPRRKHGKPASRKVLRIKSHNKMLAIAKGGLEKSFGSPNIQVGKRRADTPGHHWAAKTLDSWWNLGWPEGNEHVRPRAHTCVPRIALVNDGGGGDWARGIQMERDDADAHLSTTLAESTDRTSGRKGKGACCSKTSSGHICGPTLYHETSRAG